MLYEGHLVACATACASPLVDGMPTSTFGVGVEVPEATSWTGTWPSKMRRIGLNVFSWFGAYRPYVVGFSYAISATAICVGERSLAPNRQM